jgi:hypothetical protein
MSQSPRGGGNIKIRAYSEGNTIRHNTQIARNARIDTVGLSIWDSILTARTQNRRHAPPVIIAAEDEEHEG